MLLGGYAYVERAEPAWWVRLSYPLCYQDEILGYAKNYHLDPAMMAAVVYEESRFKADTRSSARARSGSCSSCPRPRAGSPCAPAEAAFIREPIC